MLSRWYRVREDFYILSAVGTSSRTNNFFSHPKGRSVITTQSIKDRRGTKSWTSCRKSLRMNFTRKLTNILVKTTSCYRANKATLFLRSRMFPSKHILSDRYLFFISSFYTAQSNTKLFFRLKPCLRFCYECTVFGIVLVANVASHIVFQSQEMLKFHEKAYKAKSDTFFRVLNTELSIPYS